MRHPKWFAWFIAALLFLHVSTVLAMDAVWPQLRDPEYGRRTEALRERIAEHCGRPLVLMIGSSRTAMGVKPDAWEEARSGSSHDPLLFNIGQVGSGPILELLMLRRIYADGFRPAVVLVEYWPPALRQEGKHGEATRIDPRRLRHDDIVVIRDYCPNAALERRMWVSRLNPLGTNRQRLLVQFDPEFFPRAWRVDGAWAALDGWGWLPGMDPSPDDAVARRKLIDHQRPNYRSTLNGLTIHSDSDRALREIVALARTHGSRVGFIVLPESAEFQSWYPPEVDSASRAHLANLSRELNIPVINSRNWMDECYLADGFHLSRVGAGLFTAQLGSVVAATFPDIGASP